MIGVNYFLCDDWQIRKDSFLTHRAFCESLVEGSARIGSVPAVISNFGNNLLINTQAPRNIPHGLFGLNPEYGGSGQETFMGNFPNNNIPHHSYLPNSSAFSSSGANSDLELVHTFGLLPQGQWMNYRYNDQHAETSFTSSGVLKLEQQQQEDKMHDLSHLYSQNQLQGCPSHVSTMQNTTTKVINGNNIVEVKKLFNHGNHATNFNEDQLSLTRDFLGVGDDSLKRTLLQQEMIPRFNPIGSVTNLQSEFGGHYW